MKSVMGEPSRTPSCLAVLIGALASLLCIVALAEGVARERSAATSIEELGQRLFFDPRLSADNKVSCASCHQPERAFSDGKPLAVGINGLAGTRNTPSLVDVAAQRSLFWDGRRLSLEHQALDPLLNGREHGLKSPQDALAILKGDPGYVAAFRQAFGVADDSVMNVDNLAAALAAFERTLVDGASPFDRHRAGEGTSLAQQALAGWQLFSGRAQCTRCHVADGSRALFTDHGFHSLRVGLQGIERKLPELTQRVAKLHAEDREQDHSVLADADVAALGRFVVTLDPKDIGKFKTPTLRNVGLTAPYMHDGSVPTLAEAVELEVYYRGTEDGHPLILTPEERASLVAFLQSLTGWPNSPYNTYGASASPRR